MRDSGDRRLEPLITESLSPQKSEERPQCRTHCLHRTGRVSAPQQGDELDHVGGTEPRGIDRVTLEACADEQTNQALVTVQSLLAQAACAALVLLVRLDQGIEGPRFMSCHGVLLSGH